MAVAWQRNLATTTDILENDNNIIMRNIYLVNDKRRGREGGGMGPKLKELLIDGLRMNTVVIDSGFGSGAFLSRDDDNPRRVN